MSNALDLIGTRVANRYDIQGLLGSGGMAYVYRASDRLLERDVAMKVLLERSEAIRHRFLLEARSLARLNHRGIVAIYDAGESSGIPYIVMELATGPTLAELVAAGTTVGFAVRATIELLDALQYAHERDVRGAGRGAEHEAQADEDIGPDVGVAPRERPPRRDGATKRRLFGRECGAS